MEALVLAAPVAVVEVSLQGKLVEPVLLGKVMLVVQVIVLAVNGIVTAVAVAQELLVVTLLLWLLHLILVQAVTGLLLLSQVHPLTTVAVELVEVGQGRQMGLIQEVPVV